MAESLYKDRAIQPDQPAFAIALGEHKQCWDEIIRHASQAYPKRSFKPWKPQIIDIAKKLVEVRFKA